jgi:hypothetical protein
MMSSPGWIVYTHLRNVSHEYRTNGTEVNELTVLDGALG